MAPQAATATEILRACREADCIDLAESLLAAGAPLADVQSRIEAAVTRRAEEAEADRQRTAAAAARAEGITALCGTAKLPALAPGYINGGMSLEDVRAHLTTITAVVDKAEIDTGLNPDAETARPAAKRIDTSAIYAARNART